MRFVGRAFYVLRVVRLDASQLLPPCKTWALSCQALGSNNSACTERNDCIFDSTDSTCKPVSSFTMSAAPLPVQTWRIDLKGGRSCDFVCGDSKEVCTPDFGSTTHSDGISNALKATNGGTTVCGEAQESRNTFAPYFFLLQGQPNCHYSVTAAETSTCSAIPNDMLYRRICPCTGDYLGGMGSATPKEQQACKDLPNRQCRRPRFAWSNKRRECTNAPRVRSGPSPSPGYSAASLPRKSCTKLKRKQCRRPRCKWSKKKNKCRTA